MVLYRWSPVAFAGMPNPKAYHAPARWAICGIRQSRMGRPLLSRMAASLVIGTIPSLCSSSGPS